MKLLSRDSERLVFLVTRREHALLLSTLGLRHATLSRRAPSRLSRTDDARFAEAGDQLNETLRRHRRAGFAQMDELLRDPARCVPSKSGFGLTLRQAEFELLLQMLNEIRIRAWQRMGSPDFEAGDLPKPTPDNLESYVTGEAVAGLQSKFLSAVDDDIE
jgi:hypothetical protein